MPILPMILLLLLLGNLAAATVHAAPALEERIRRFTLLAAERSADALVRDARLAQIARAHSRAMYEAGQLAHELRGAGPDERLALAHRRLFGLVAENVAMQKGWPAPPHGAARVSIDPPDTPGESDGTQWRSTRATLTLPQRPGRYRLRFWQPQPEDPSRFGLIPGPFVCLLAKDASATTLPRSCPDAD